MEDLDQLNWLKFDPLEKLNQAKLDRLARGEPLIDLSMINPDTEPPSFALDKLTEAVLKTSNHRYSVSRGIRRLRDAFADKYNKVFGVSLDAEKEVCVSAGTKDALLLAFGCLTKPGDRILVGKPTYPMFSSVAHWCGLKMDYFEISCDENAMLQNIEEQISKEIYSVLLLNFPNNPTGVSVSPYFYCSLADLVKRNDTFVINDFVYGEMGYQSGKIISALSEPSLRSRTLESYSLSKAYSIPGWRVASIAGAESVIGHISKLKSHVDYGIFLPIQIAAAAILTAKEDLVKNALANYINRSKVLAGGLSRLGWEVFSPGAGASVWAKLPSFYADVDSLQFAEKFLMDHGVVVLPGFLFGVEYSSFVRFALVVSEEEIREVILRLEEFFSSIAS